MRYIQVPADVTLPLAPEVQRQIDVERAAGRPVVTPALEVFSVKRFAFTMWLEDPRAMMSGDRFSLAMQRRWGKVIDKFEVASAGDTIMVDDQDWTVLCKIVEAPQAIVTPSAMRHLFVFSDAVIEASETAPPHAI
jgi:hypothetical protein